jgi:FlaA1/EpsC-like NDP-sugar epimerase
MIGVFRTRGASSWNARLCQLPAMDAGLSSKVVWITGAAGGIGCELARADLTR